MISRLKTNKGENDSAARVQRQFCSYYDDHECLLEVSLRTL